MKRPKNEKKCPVYLGFDALCPAANTCGVGDRKAAAGLAANPVRAVLEEATPLKHVVLFAQLQRSGHWRAGNSGALGVA